MPILVKGIIAVQFLGSTIDLLKKLQAFREKQRQSEQELETLFRSLIQKAFSGELVA